MGIRVGKFILHKQGEWSVGGELRLQKHHAPRVKGGEKVVAVRIVTMTTTMILWMMMMMVMEKEKQMTTPFGGSLATTAGGWLTRVALLLLLMMMGNARSQSTSVYLPKERQRHGGRVSRTMGVMCGVRELLENGWLDKWAAEAMVVLKLCGGQLLGEGCRWHYTCIGDTIRREIGRTNGDDLNRKSEGGKDETKGGFGGRKLLGRGVRWRTRVRLGCRVQ